MDTVNYFEGRLRASIRLMNAASEPRARRAHEGLANGYEVLIARSRATIELDESNMTVVALPGSDLTQIVSSGKSATLLPQTRKR